MQLVFVIKDNKVAEAYENHIEQGVMAFIPDWQGITVDEIENRLKAEFEKVSKIGEVGDEIIYEVE
jgi:hypothetical protein